MLALKNRGEKIRILHAITRLINGGAQINTLYTVTGLDKKRYSVSLISGQSNGVEGEIEGEARQMGVNLTVIPELVREVNPFLDSRAFLKLYRLIKHGKYDIVHTHTSKVGILGRLAAKLAGNSIIVHTPHGSNYYNPKADIPSVSGRLINRTLFLWLDRLTATITDEIIGLTESEVEHYLEIGFIKNRNDAVVIHSGIDLKKFAEIDLDTDGLTAQLGIPDGFKVILTVARLTGEKGHEYLIHAAKRVANETEKVRFLFVGDGILRSKLEDQVRQLRLDQVISFLGVRRDVPELLAISDLFVLPSLYEGQGRALVEAMAAGLPVVATKVGGIPDVISDGQNGILVAALDSDALAVAILELLNNEEKARQMGEAGKRRVDPEFSVETMVRKIESVYEELIKRKLGMGRISARTS